ncbi:hypothetical protein [Nonomuraea sp. NPDC049625]|uniref:hypothetical protein n=1 Tax=Nonomuraea sp. NPDC049625 TaxID=3155775 RepID=UPI003437A558
MRPDAAGLPTIRRHDLCHGAVTKALASRTELKVVQGTLRHAGIVLTADTHVSVLPHLYHDTARMAVRLVLKAGDQPEGRRGADGGVIHMRLTVTNDQMTRSQDAEDEIGCPLKARLYPMAWAGGFG